VEKPDVVALLQKSYDDWNAQLARPLWPSPQAGKQKKKQ
jgi:hypothetical protein